MDSKYANLAGIAQNEPDTYETPDAPTLDHDLLRNDTLIGTSSATSVDSSAVQTIEISTKEAFDKFSKQQELNSDLVDFSDSISKYCSAGYLTDMAGLKRVETPFQKYNRLLNELNSLKSDLEHDSEEQKKSSSCDNNQESDDSGINSLLGEVEKLQKQAATLQLETLNSSINSFDKKSKKNMLINQLNEFKKLPDSTKSGKEHSTSINDKNNSITFKIFNDVDSLTLKDATKLADLNQRLSRLESILDSKANKDLLTSSTINSENKTVLGLIENMNSRINLIDMQSFEVILSKFQWMMERLGQLSEKKALFDDNEKYKKVNELYTKLIKWQDMFSMVPKLIERLASLNELHQQASQFSSTLSRLDADNLSLKQKLDTNIHCISQMKTNLDDNMLLIRTNFENLQKFVQNDESK